MPTGSRGLQEALTPVPRSTRASWLRAQERHPPVPKQQGGSYRGPAHPSCHPSPPGWHKGTGPSPRNPP